MRIIRKAPQWRHKQSLYGFSRRQLRFVDAQRALFRCMESKGSQAKHRERRQQCSDHDPTC